MAMSGKPVLVYFPAAGRGELCRLIAAAGGVDIEENFPGPQYARKVGWLGSLPVVIHGNFSICQSDACQKYLARLSPKFTDLTAEQIAVDDMFAGAKEDMGQFAYPAASTEDPEVKKKAKDGYDRVLGALEDLVPAEGFVNGLAYPTVADMVLVNILEAAMPHAAACQNIGYDFGKFEKIKANVERSKVAPGVAEYLATSTTMKAVVGAKEKAVIVAKALGHLVSFNTMRDPVYKEFDLAGKSAPASTPVRTFDPVSPDNPDLVYFPIAGRGELARLIAAAGGVELENSFPGVEMWKAEVGLFGSMPLLKHGEFRLAQSAAIESYLSLISPKFKDLTDQQRAFDDCFGGCKEDMLAGCAKYIFSQDEVFKGKAPVELPKMFDKFFKVFEDKTPATGFIQGLEFPTIADLVLLNITEAVMPFGEALKLCPAYDWQAKYPKVKANIARTKEAQGVKDYLAETKSMKTDFAAMMALT